MRHPIHNKARSVGGNNPARRRRFGGYRADGGDVQQDKSYVVGEKGPETFVPDALQKPVIALGGAGSTINEKFFPIIQGSGAKDITYYPLAPTQNFLGGTGIERATKEIGDLLTQKTAGGQDVVVPAHSLSGPILYNYLRAHPNPHVQPMYLDPPNLSWWMKPHPKFMGKLLPTVNSIQTANDAGIAGDTNTVNWTSGHWLSNKAGHSPWNYPDAPGSQQRMNDLTNLLRSRITMPVGTNGPALFNPDQPGRIIPNQSFAPILDDIN